jgi:hypothetical protein
MQTPFSLPETIALLSRTPSTLNTFLRGLPSRWVAANEGADSWSAFDIVGHLVIGERTDSRLSLTSRQQLLAVLRDDFRHGIISKAA